jgi:hypothetical protein
MHSIYCPVLLNKITDNHIATIYEAYQAEIDLSLEGFWKEVVRWRTLWPLQNGKVDFVTYLIL